MRTIFTEDVMVLYKQYQYLVKVGNHRLAAEVQQQAQQILLNRAGK